MERLLRLVEHHRLLASFIRGTGVPLSRPPKEICQKAPLAVEEIYALPYSEQASGYFSTCLYSGGEGWEKTYFYPLVESGKDWLAAFPGWRFRVYVPVDFPPDKSHEMVAAGFEVYRMNREKEDNAPTLWRFLPAAQELPVLSIDADWPFREDLAQHFRRWLASGKKFYWRRENGGIFWPVAASNWGSRGGIPGWEEKVSRFTDMCNCFGCDELFLKIELYPLLTSDQTYLVKTPHFEFFWALAFFFFLVAFGFLLWSTRLAGRAPSTDP